MSIYEQGPADTSTSTSAAGGGISAPVEAKRAADWEISWARCFNSYSFPGSRFLANNPVCSLLSLLLAVLMVLVLVFDDTSTFATDDIIQGNLLLNGGLDGPLIPMISTQGSPHAGDMTIAHWGTNNAQVSLVPWHGRQSAVKVDDAGSFSDLGQTIATIPGRTYTISYDVWADDVLTNTAGHGLCTSADSNGILIVRQGTTVLSGIAGTSHCGGEASGAQTIVDHCHGDQLLCPLTSQRWVTVSGTYTAVSTRTTIALHSEGSHAAYFDRVMFTEQPDPCLPSLESTETGPPICQCARIGEL